MAEFTSDSTYKPFTLEHFKNNIKNLLRPNRFVVNIRCINTDVRFDSCISAVIPDRSFSEIEIKYYGMSYKLPAGEIIQDLVLTFHNDETYLVRKIFERWANVINNRSDIETATSIKTTMRDLGTNWVEVTQLDSQNNSIAEYKFHNCFPKIVDQIELNMESIDSTETFQVTFAYSHWTVKYFRPNSPEQPKNIPNMFVKMRNKLGI